jgi:hypothetical protein
MLIFQTLMGLIMTVVFVGAAERFAASFVPEEVRSASLSYVRLSAPVALSSAIQVAVGSSTRALDQPDVPLIISSVGFTLNIVLDLLVISKFHVGSYTPTVLTQAGIRLACDMISAIAGVLYFVYLTRKLKRDLRLEGVVEEIAPQIKALKILARPTIYTFTESFTRNGFYLWVVSTIIGLGSTYATAWGVFNTIRWGLIMVPVNALQASSLTFVGHEWSVWHARVDARDSKPTASKADLRGLWYLLSAGDIANVCTRNCQTGFHICWTGSGCRDSNLYSFIPVGYETVFLLSVQFDGCRSGGGKDVAGRYFRAWSYVIVLTPP